MMAATVGITVNTFTIISPAMIADLGITATQVQLISLVSTFANMFAGLFVGKVMARFTMRVAMPVYAVLTAAGFFLYSLCESLVMFYLVSVLVGIGMSGVSLVPCGALLNNWFSEKKGLATGIAFSGSVAGGMIFVQVTQAVVDASGWRMGYIVLGIISAVLLIVTTVAGCKHAREYSTAND